MPADRRTFVIVGASLAGASAAATLREEGFDGRLILIGDEEVPPYERPGLSKTYLRGETTGASLTIRPPGWFEEQQIEPWFGRRVTELDAPRHTLELTGGEHLSYDAALIATGARNRRLDVPGADLAGVFQLRTLDDANRIRAAALAVERAVVVGMGFIGAEVAASLRQMGLDVTVLEALPGPLYRVLGPEISGALRSLHEEHGVRMRFDDAVARFEGDGSLSAVTTTKGQVIEAGFAVVGVGTTPNAELMGGFGIAGNGGIAVGPTLETGHPDVFAAGDVATHDHRLFGPIRVEHFDNAIRMGESAARNMLGAGAVYEDPHWFWSDQYTAQIQMAGFAPEWSKMVVRGSLSARSFCAFQLDDEGIVIGAVSMDWPRDVRRSFGLITKQVAPAPQALEDPDVDIRELIPPD
ncbi:MAG: 3-phenylpropionate/trans-cinnamate dioxygenase ferredoxin reductase component [Actinomycetota bacterium]|jgi:3-phenylpropionate/trans-cinnamate dioxygenase ferredoxin reductase subunit|nr:3-phenylpropionate/trans-cinnamate dioxygenase ferredoxin reductase component [Actinomycetota bacterium]